MLSCDESNGVHSQEIEGEWRVIRLVSNDDKNEFDETGEDVRCEYIKLIIPNDTSGTASGSTLHNSFWLDYEAKKEDKITFTNYGGTRIAENQCGIDFSDGLSRVSSFLIENDTLYMMDLNQIILITFIKTIN